jgi:hypothetical protein
VVLDSNFYHGLKRASRAHLDAAVGGAFFSLQVPTCRMDIPGPTTQVGARTDYSVGP